MERYEAAVNFAQALAARWTDPVVRMQDVFRVRDNKGNLAPLIIPEPQKQFIRDGILGTGYNIARSGSVVRRWIIKGRQTGFSIIQAAEAILIAHDFPRTFQYYVSARGEQAARWLQKLEQMAKDANNYPTILGGRPVVRCTNLKPYMRKVIGDCEIIGFAANPSGMRGETAINVILDEFAWMILKKNQQIETYTACKHFLSQGGQLTIQSTPRTETDLFMELGKEKEKHGFKSYFCPTISNWKELELNKPLYIEFDNKQRLAQGLKALSDLEKIEMAEKLDRDSSYIKGENCYMQNAIIPYPWKKLSELEVDRRSDLELFKQENLGVAVDERYKVLKGEWIYENLVFDVEQPSRGDSFNRFTIGVDIAKMHDLFIAVVFEEINDHWFCRKVEIMPTGQNYVDSAAKLEDLNKAFQPCAIRVDATGGGIPFCDILEKGSCKPVLQRVTFTNSTKMNLAENLKNIAQNNRLHFIENVDSHKLVIRHLLKVEKHYLKESTKYSGKGVDQEGRDDGFWAVALAICNNPARDAIAARRGIRAGFHSITRKGNKIEASGTRYEQIKSSNIIQNKVIDMPTEEIQMDTESKACAEVCKRLEKGLLACPKLNKTINPIECLNCDWRHCYEWDYHENIIKNTGLNKNIVLRWYNEQKSDKTNEIIIKNKENKDIS